MLCKVMFTRGDEVMGSGEKKRKPVKRHSDLRLFSIY